MRKHLNIKIYGDVIDVGFRYHAMLTAENFGIKGFVRNEPDGTVYIEAEGEEGKLEEFLAWCHRGPKYAKVTRVETEEGALKNFVRFTIEH